MSRVLITGARAPVALHIARAVADAGFEAHVVDTLAHPLTAKSRRITQYHRLPPPSENPIAFAEALSELIDLLNPSHVVPTCEEVFYLAWAFEAYRLGCARGRGDTSVRLLAPSFAALARAHNKSVFAEDARACGMAPPDTILLTSRESVARHRSRASQLVFKPVWSRFAALVLIAPEPQELDAIVPTPNAPWIAQELIPGEELCVYAIARHGRVCAITIYRPTHRAGRGAGIYFVPCDDADIQRDVAAYVAATGWTGQIAFDFRRDEGGRPRVLECNPRATSGAFAFGPDSDLTDALLAGTAAQPTVTEPLMISTAMVLYALAPAIGRGRLRDWIQDFRLARNAMAWPGDRLPLSAESLAVLELTRVARQQGIRLIEASTSGIAWDGQPLPHAAAADRLLANRLITETKR